MNPKLLRYAFLAASFAIAFYSRTYNSYPPTAYTSGPSESNCATSGCHATYSLQTGGAKWSNISLTGNFTGNGYLPDSVYTLVLQYKETGIARFGFEITCLDGSNLAAGKFATADSRTNVSTGTVGGKTRYYAFHSYTGTSPVSTDSTAWKIKWTAPSSNVGNVKFYINLNSANNNSQETGDYIYAKTFTVSLSTLFPTAKVKLVDSIPCAGSNLTFKATVTGNPTNYYWKFPGATPDTSNLSTVTVKYPNAGIQKAILYVKSSKGISKRDTYSFAVNPAASPVSVTPSAAQSICKGDSVKLSASLLSGHTYKWSPTGSTNTAVFAKDSAQYFVTVKNSYKCTAVSNKVLVKPQPVPIVTISKSFSADSICEGQRFYLQGNIQTGSVDSWSFVSKKGPYYIKDTTWPKTSPGDMNAKVWGKSSNGCSGVSSNLLIHVKALATGPALSISNIAYTGFRVGWSSVANATGYRVSTDSGKTFTLPSSGNNGLYHDVSGLMGNHSMKVLVYAITNDYCGVTQTASIIGTTSSCAPIDFSIHWDKTKYCPGENAKLVVNGLKNKQYSVALDGVNKARDTVFQFAQPKTTSYEISVLDSTDLVCGYTKKNAVLVVDTIAAPTWDMPASQKICTNNASAPLAVKSGSGQGQDSFLFYLNGLLQARNKQGTYTYTVKNSDIISMKAKNLRGCVSLQSASSSIVLQKLPDATFTTKNTGHQYVFVPKIISAAHSWIMDTFHSTADSAQFDLQGWDKKSLKMVHRITANGCTGADSQTFAVPDFASTYVLQSGDVKVFPNPTQAALEVHLPLNIHTTFVLLDIYGRVVFSHQLEGGDNHLWLGVMAAGTYFYRVGEGSNIHGKLLITGAD